MINTPPGRITFLIAIFSASGVLHFLRPAPFVAIVPEVLPRKKELVHISGLIELVGAVMLAIPRTRRRGGALAAALLVGVFPANVSMAIRADRRPRWYRAAAWARLPLQLPLVKWAWQAGQEGQAVATLARTPAMNRATPPR
jgi:uncharacterized membrane protein